MSNQGQNQKKEPNLLLMAIGFLIIGFGIVILLRGIRINVDTSEVLLSEDGVQTVNSTDFTLIEEETHGERLNDGTYVIEGKLRQEIEVRRRDIRYAHLETVYYRSCYCRRVVRSDLCDGFPGKFLWRYEFYRRAADGVQGSSSSSGASAAAEKETETT